MRRAIDETLRQLEDLIRQNRFDELETDTLEIKPIPADTGQWRERYKSINAFLNTQGGILILGVKEEGQGTARRYIFTGWHTHAEPKLSELPTLFTDRERRPLLLTAAFPPPEIHDFMEGKVALVYVDELSAEQKFAFYEGHAYKRILTGDHRIKEAEIEAQEEYKREVWHQRELQPVADTNVDSFDLDKINDYIQLLNRTVRVETFKASLDVARTFLERKKFLHNGHVTTLGMLVCGRYPGDYLNFRCQLHGYVDMTGVIAQDKRIFINNVLPLMEEGLAYLRRNIQVGITVANGGSEQPQYPEELLRETINNALAHRDYSIDRQVFVTIKPGAHISITNPGSFRSNLLLETRRHAVQALRIIPEAKPRNPLLAKVLGDYSKWEGRGIGMATLVNLCLEDRINLPYYRLRQDEVQLFLCAGRLLDARIERLLASFDGYLLQKRNGIQLTLSQQLVLAYLIKSEWANVQERHTIMLTPDNNHYEELRDLERSGVIEKHPESLELYPIYIVNRELMRQDYTDALRTLFGATYDTLPSFSKECLNVVYRYQHFSRSGAISAKQAGYYLWAQQSGDDNDVRALDNFLRKVRYAFNRLTQSDLIVNKSGASGYVLNETYRTTHLDF